MAVDATRLQTLPISLAKSTLSACQVLLAYFIISAVRMVVVSSVLDPAVERLGRFRVRGVVVADQGQRRMAEVLDRRALAQELGIDRDAEAGAVPLPDVRSSAGMTTSCVVPGSTVLRTTTTW